MPDTGRLGARREGRRLSAVAVNEQIRVAEGENGTIVVLSAWCPTCNEHSMPLNDGNCAFCLHPIVDYDALTAKTLLALMKPARAETNVIPLRLVAEQPRAGVQRWTLDTSVAAVQAWAAREGRPPRQKDATGDPLLPSASTARDFGLSWADLIERSGFPRPHRGGAGGRALSPAARQAIKDGMQRAREEPAPVIQEALDRAITLAPGLHLPPDAAGEAIAILAKRGAGKTNTGRVLVEELIRLDVQTVILDPVGAWWGLRSSADGHGDGLPLPILGGAHGDAPLPTCAGRGLAEMVVQTGRSLILDLSDFTRDEQRTFAADFADTLYLAKARHPSLIHVVLEEADEFAPQKTRGGGDREENSRMRGAVETLARRGRSRGIGMTMITQRSAGLSKDALTQADILVVMRTTGPTDVKAIEEWVRHQDAEGSRDVVPSLASLKTGEAWVWNPERELLRRVQIRLAWTFDSSATPKAGQPSVEPERVAAVELVIAAIADDEEEPESDHRTVDDEGRWGCKIDGCGGRSSRCRGQLAYLCDDLHAPEKSARTQRVVRRGVELAKQRREPLRTPDAPSVELEPIETAEASLPFTLALTGDFASDARRVRAEAELLRRQAEALDRIADGLDDLQVSVS